MNELRVLVADDEVGMQAAVERVLSHYTAWLPEAQCEVGFAVSRASTGEEALAAIQSDPPQILLLDYKLPGMSGLEVLQQIPPELHARLLTIMITAYASLEAAVTATKRGAYDFLAKPFNPEELKNTVAKAAGRLILAQRARQLEEEKRQVRFQFISVLTHELKAPLAAVEGYLRIIRGKMAGQDQATYDRMLDRSLERLEGMRKLILDLLDMTRIESGQKSREFAEVDVRAVATAALDGVRPEAQKRGISLELAGDGPVLVPADRGEIEIILNNLVSNAVKYNRNGGRVDVRLGLEDATLAIEVADSGIGMTAEEAAGLFNDFVRIKNDKTRNILGSGLGLSILKKLAMLYDGDVSVQSEPDKGSTFRVVLRCGEPEPAGEQPAS
jgi:two-component system sensor histidine kinase/response regulator